MLLISPRPLDLLLCSLWLQTTSPILTFHSLRHELKVHSMINPHISIVFKETATQSLQYDD